MKAATRRRMAHRARATMSPVGVAVARRLMRSHQLDLSIALYMHDHGAPAAELLADLGYTLALGSEIEAEARRGSPACRQIHAALRTVIATSAAGNRWDSAHAATLHAAADKAQALVLAHPVQPVARQMDCEWIASRILAGTATLADVAGAEIYAEPGASHE